MNNKIKNLIWILALFPIMMYFTGVLGIINEIFGFNFQVFNNNDTIKTLLEGGQDISNKGFALGGTGENNLFSQIFHTSQPILIPELSSFIQEMINGFFGIVNFVIYEPVFDIPNNVLNLATNNIGEYVVNSNGQLTLYDILMVLFFRIVPSILVLYMLLTLVLNNNMFHEKIGNIYSVKGFIQNNMILKLLMYLTIFTFLIQPAVGRIQVVSVERCTSSVNDICWNGKNKNELIYKIPNLMYMIMKPISIYLMGLEAGMNELPTNVATVTDRPIKKTILNEIFYEIYNDSIDVDITSTSNIQKANNFLMLPAKKILSDSQASTNLKIFEVNNNFQSELYEKYNEKQVEQTTVYNGKLFNRFEVVSRKIKEEEIIKNTLNNDSTYKLTLTEEPRKEIKEQIVSLKLKEYLRNEYINNNKVVNNDLTRLFMTTNNTDITKKIIPINNLNYNALLYLTKKEYINYIEDYTKSEKDQINKNMYEFVISSDTYYIEPKNNRLKNGLKTKDGKYIDTPYDSTLYKGVPKILIEQYNTLLNDIKDKSVFDYDFRGLKRIHKKRGVHQTPNQIIEYYALLKRLYMNIQMINIIDKEKRIIKEKIKSSEAKVNIPQLYFNMSFANNAYHKLFKEDLVNNSYYNSDHFSNGAEKNVICSYMVSEVGPLTNGCTVNRNREVINQQLIRTLLNFKDNKIQKEYIKDETNNTGEVYCNLGEVYEKNCISCEVKSCIKEKMKKYSIGIQSIYKEKENKLKKYTEINKDYCESVTKTYFTKSVPTPDGVEIGNINSMEYGITNIEQEHNKPIWNTLETNVIEIELNKTTNNICRTTTPQINETTLTEPHKKFLFKELNKSYKLMNYDISIFNYIEGFISPIVDLTLFDVFWKGFPEEEIESENKELIGKYGLKYENTSLISSKALYHDKLIYRENYDGTNQYENDVGVSVFFHPSLITSGPSTNTKPKKEELSYNPKLSDTSSGSSYISITSMEYEIAKVKYLMENITEIESKEKKKLIEKYYDFLIELYTYNGNRNFKLKTIEQLNKYGSLMTALGIYIYKENNKIISNEKKIQYKDKSELGKILLMHGQQVYDIYLKTKNWNNSDKIENQTINDDDKIKDYFILKNNIYKGKIISNYFDPFVSRITKGKQSPTEILPMFKRNNQYYWNFVYDQQINNSSNVFLQNSTNKKQINLTNFWTQSELNDLNAYYTNSVDIDAKINKMTENYKKVLDLQVNHILNNTQQSIIMEEIKKFQDTIILPFIKALKEEYIVAKMFFGGPEMLVTMTYGVKEIYKKTGELIEGVAEKIYDFFSMFDNDNVTINKVEFKKLRGLDVEEKERSYKKIQKEEMESIQTLNTISLYLSYNLNKYVGAIDNILKEMFVSKKDENSNIISNNIVTIQPNEIENIKPNVFDFELEYNISYFSYLDTSKAFVNIKDLDKVSEIKYNNKTIKTEEKIIEDELIRNLEKEKDGLIDVAIQIAQIKVVMTTVDVSVYFLKRVFPGLSIFGETIEEITGLVGSLITNILIIIVIIPIVLYITYICVVGMIAVIVIRVMISFYINFIRIIFQLLFKLLKFLKVLIYDNVKEVLIFVYKVISSIVSGATIKEEVEKLNTNFLNIRPLIESISMSIFEIGFRLIIIIVMTLFLINFSNITGVYITDSYILYSIHEELISYQLVLPFVILLQFYILYWPLEKIIKKL